MPTPEQLERLAFTEVVEGSPLHQLVTEHQQKPAPDSRDWWQEVAQGLGVRAFELKAQRDELLVALRSAVETIRTWHNMGHYAGEADRVWALYQESPEMKAINAALVKAEQAER